MTARWGGAGIGRAVLGLLLVVLTASACSAGSTDDQPTRTAAAPVPQSSSRADLVDKLAAIGRDECATQSAAQVYPRCARFAREVANATVAARAVAPTEAAVATAANAVDGAVDRLTKDGCLLAAQQGATGGPQTCGPDLTALQDALRALRSALGT